MQGPVPIVAHSRTPQISDSIRVIVTIMAVGLLVILLLRTMASFMTILEVMVKAVAFGSVATVLLASILMEGALPDELRSEAYEVKMKWAFQHCWSFISRQISLATNSGMGK